MDEFDIRKRINEILNNLLIFSIVLISSVLIAVRVFGQDNDYQNYLYFWDNMTPGFSDSESRFEIVFVLLAELFKYIFHSSFTVFLFFIAFTSLSVKFHLFGKNKDFYFIALMYLLSMALFHEMTQIRAALAIALAFTAIYLRAKKQFTAAFVIFLISCFSHYSMLFLAIIFFPPHRWLEKGILSDKRLIIFGLLASFALGTTVSIMAQIIPMLRLYAERADIESFNFFSVRVVAVMPVLVFGFLSYRSFSSFEKRCYILSFVGLLLTPATSIIPTLASRLYELSFVGYFFWLPGIRRYKLLSYTFFALVCVYLFMRNVFISPIFNLA
ncbi:EpsG family protein [Erwiniaceae bacterium CAU 1747]